MSTRRRYLFPLLRPLPCALGLATVLLAAALATAGGRLTDGQERRRAERRAQERREEEARQRRFDKQETRLDQRIPGRDVRIQDVKIDDQGYLDVEIRRDRAERRAEAQQVRTEAELAAARARRRREAEAADAERRRDATRAAHRQSTRITVLGF